MTRSFRPFDMRHFASAVGCALLLTWSLAGAGVMAQSPAQRPTRPPNGASGGGSSSTERLISSSVAASWMSHWRASDGDTRTLLVLWRGTPGWFAKRGSAGRSSSGGGGGSTGWQTFTEGGMTFELEYDFDRNVVKLLEQEVSLKDSNVVLVDLVDSPGGPRIVDRLWIDTPAQEQPGPPDPIHAIVRSSPRLFEFVRCDAKMPDQPGSPPAAAAYFNDVMGAMCAQMRPR
jgi:hypothetical protein